MNLSRLISIAIVLGIMAFTMNISAYQGGLMVSHTYPNCPDYELVTYMAAFEDSVEAMYYISRRDPIRTLSRTHMLDSIRAVYATAADTNTFIFVCTEGKTYHLVVANTSPTVKLDTIMTQGNDPPDNWLAYPKRVTIVPDFGIVAGIFGHEWDSNIHEIRRIKRDGTTTLLHSIKNAPGMDVSLDRNELYFTIQDREGVAHSYLKVYDVAADSFWVLQDSTFSLENPFRSTKNSPLYYTKRLRINNEFWKMMPDGSRELARAFNRWEYFRNVNEYMDTLEVVVGNSKTDTTYTLYFVH